MAQIVSLNSHDYMPVDIIPVIAAFNEQGQIKPLYVGINGKQYKVASYWVRRNFANQIEFSCRLLSEESLQTYIITYYMNECIWTIPVNK